MTDDSMTIITSEEKAEFSDATIGSGIQETAKPTESAVKITDFNAYYGNIHALKNINLDIPQNRIFAFIGPSGCGKTTLLRSINRLNDLVPSFRQEGRIEIDGTDIYTYRDKKTVENLRTQIGMVFQQPNPLPMTIMQNMLLPLKEHYQGKQKDMESLAIQKLTSAGLYEEVQDRLHKTALRLSGGQQHRLCIARSLMLEPKIILFDEPCSALDYISTLRIEELLRQLKENYTIIMVTHNMEQATRIADFTAFFYQGEIIEHNSTKELFTLPKMELTEKYIQGKM